jgi:hypothetical protein
VTVAQWSTVFARSALTILCIIVAVSAPRRSVRVLGAVGAVLLAASLTLVFFYGGI